MTGNSEVDSDKGMCGRITSGLPTNRQESSGSAAHPLIVEKRVHFKSARFLCSKKCCWHAIPNERISANCGMTRRFSNRGSVSIWG
jgi:hypothetical protein